MTSHVGDVLDVGLPGGGCGLVELPGDDERGRGDLMQPVDDAPAAQRAEDVKLVGAVHGVVDRRLRLHLRDGVDEVLRHRHDPAHMASVELVRRRQVLRVGDSARRFMTLEGGQGVRRQLGPQFVGRGHPQRHRRGRIADRQRREPGGLPDRDLRAQHAAPGLAQQVVFVDAERAAHRVELVDEQFGRPEVGGGIGQVGAGAAADLVVVDDRRDRFPRPVRRCCGHSGVPFPGRHAGRTGVGRRRALVGRGDLHPGFVAAERHQAGRHEAWRSAWTRKGLVARPLIRN